MANYIMALRYTEPFIKSDEERLAREILGAEEQEETKSGEPRYFEPVIKIIGETGSRIEKIRSYEQRKRLAYTDVIYIRQHTDKAQLEKEYRDQLERSLLNNDVILIEPRSVGTFVSRTIRFGFYFFFLCFGLSAGSFFVGKFYRHKTYLTCSLFLGGALMTLLYSTSYETWPISDFNLLSDPLLCGVYCSPAVIFKTETPVAIFRNFDRFYRVQFLYGCSAAAGLQLLYRLYTGPPPYLCPCASTQFPEFPRYASLLLPLFFRVCCVRSTG